MATQIVISNEDYIKVDDSHIQWVDKGNAMPSLSHGVANSVHYVIWNNLSGQNEVQKCDENGAMIGNISLNSLTDVVHDTTTVQNLLDWGEVRKGQISQATIDWKAAGGGELGTTSEGKTWIDYDPNYS